MELNTRIGASSPPFLNHLILLIERIVCISKQMADFEDKPQSFFVFCFGDFSSKLRIPTAFENKYPEFLRQVFVELKTAAGKSWDVKIKNMSNEWYFAGGWSEFATENRLVEFNLLTFRISGDSALDVSIFRNNSCLDDPHSPPPPPSHDRDTSAKTWRFVKELKHHNFSVLRMDMPQRFVMGAGITAGSNTELEDVEGRRWPVSITDRSIGVFGMTRGWMDFLRGNNLRVGTFLLFEFVKNSNNVIKVVPMEKEAGKKLRAQAKKGGFLC